MDSLVDSCLVSLADSCLDSSVDSCLDSLVDSCLDSLVDSCLDSSVDSCLDSSVDSCLDSSVDSCLDSSVDSCLDSLVDSCLDSSVGFCLVSLVVGAFSPEVSAVGAGVSTAGVELVASVPADSAFAARGLAATQAVKARDIAASLNFLLVMITLSFRIFTCYKRDINRTGPHWPIPEFMLVIWVYHTFGSLSTRGRVLEKTLKIRRNA